VHWLRERLRTFARRRRMTDALWIGAVTLLLFAYLVYALLVPEKF
jgi:K+-transporting ATPase KdpF subunit